MPATAYQSFLETKADVVLPSGFDVGTETVHPMLHDFQRSVVRWAVRKGRAAIFADCGLGKTFMQVEWARLLLEHSGADFGLIVAPLCVAQQTRSEAAKLGVDVTLCRGQDDVRDGLNVINYEMLAHIEPEAFGVVVLDESSILKNFTGKIRTQIIEAFRETPYRLACTATPCPNDIAELANHVEYLGLMTREEMLATYFVHDDTGWRLKGHATDAFWRWMASWAMTFRSPADLGFDDTAFRLPPLNIHDVAVHYDGATPGFLFRMPLKGIQERSAMRKATMLQRVDAAAALINGSDEQWLVWCNLNAEADGITASVPDAQQIQGNDAISVKEERTRAFQAGELRVLVTKPKISGFGLNLQQCHNIVFVGLSDSYEQYYQCIRRCWRYGQRSAVNAYIVVSDAESVVVDNVHDKEKEARAMAENILAHVRDHEREELGNTTRERDDYAVTVERGKAWEAWRGDCIEVLAEHFEDDSIDLSVFSPPFASLYTYSNSPRDLGNSRTDEQFYDHFGYLAEQLMRVTRQGRECCVHVMQLPARLVTDGYIGIKDFRADVVKVFQGAGWVYHGEVCIDKDPQAQAIRTKSKCLLFTQGKKDSTWLRPALADYILVFRKAGDAEHPVRALYDAKTNPGGWVTNDEWIEWARPIWYGIRESDTLSVVEAREHDDERHICPLQLGTIERCIALWSAPGETVLSPFGGIGSEGYQAITMGRKARIIELKDSYWRVACRNLATAEAKAAEATLFDAEGAGKGAQ